MSDNVTPSNSPTGPNSALPPAGPRRRNWRHIYGTRARTSTAALCVLFIVCVVIYGYTSQRYGVVAPPPPRHVHATRVEPTPEYTETSPSSSSSTSPSTSAADSSASGESGSEPGVSPAAPDSEPAHRSATPIIPGLPFLAPQTSTRAVP